MLILKFLKTDIAKSHFDLSRMINETMDVLNNTSSYNLIFTSQANLIMYSGVGSFLQPICHNQINFSKFNFKNYHLPPNKWVWHYQHVNMEPIIRVIDLFDWENRPYDTKLKVRGLKFKRGSVSELKTELEVWGAHEKLA